MTSDAKNTEMPAAMILCGGKGTRLRDINEVLPKPLVPIGEYPIVWHIMKSYAAFGVKRFILCLGYKKEEFVDYFINYHSRTYDVTIDLARENNLQIHSTGSREDWQVTLANTGLETLTAGRVRIAAKYLNETDEDFFLTYGDGVSDLNFEEELKFHRKHGKMLTCLAVKPAARFGEMLIKDNKVINFNEKPAASEGYINGGFMIMKKEFLEKYLNKQENQALEQEPMNNAAEDGEMCAYKHQGFWQCMDNPREYQLLNELWQNKQAPWTKHWNGSAEL